MTSPTNEQQRVDVLRREVKFSPAFDKRDPDPSKNYGIHGVDLGMYVTGEAGAVQFVLYTNWMLPHVQSELETRAAMGLRDIARLRPNPADLGYHSKAPMYEGHRPTANCHLLGCDCYYDGSSLNAERIYDVLLREGSDGVWRELESYYAEIFGAALANVGAQK